jgi:hypothetical protein
LASLERTTGSVESEPEKRPSQSLANENPHVTGNGLPSGHPASHLETTQSRAGHFGNTKGDRFQNATLDSSLPKMTGVGAIDVAKNNGLL